MKGNPIRQVLGATLPSALAMLMRSAGLIVLLMLVFLLFMGGQNTSAGAGRFFYVGPIGDDSNPGSLSQPFLTLQQGRSIVSKNP